MNLPVALQGSKAPSLSDLEEQLLTSSPPSCSFSSPLPYVPLFLLLILLSSVCALGPWADGGFSPRLSVSHIQILPRSLPLPFAGVPSSTSPARKACLPVTLWLSFLRLPGPAALIPLRPFCLSPPDSLSLFSPALSLLFALRLSFTHSRYTVLLLALLTLVPAPLLNFPSLSASVPPIHQSIHPSI